MLFILLLRHSLVSLFFTLTPAFINPKKTPDFSITSRAFRGFLLPFYCSSCIPNRNPSVECISEEAALSLLMIESCFQFLPYLGQEIFFYPLWFITYNTLLKSIAPRSYVIKRQSCVIWRIDLKSLHLRAIQSLLFQGNKSEN